MPGGATQCWLGRFLAEPCLKDSKIRPGINLSAFGSHVRRDQSPRCCASWHVVLIATRKPAYLREMMHELIVRHVGIKRRLQLTQAACMLTSQANKISAGASGHEACCYFRLIRYLLRMYRCIWM